MLCPNCQHQNSPTAKFCEECGTKLSPGSKSEPQKENSGHSHSSLTDAPIKNKPTTDLVGRSKTKAERRQLTVLFCDLIGSTALSTRLDPEEYRQVILDYQQVAEKVVRRYDGHIAQYLGDGLLVYFGYPKGLEDAPRACVRAGLGIIEAVEMANRQWVTAGKTQIAIRIGIHTGIVVVDDHLALGDTTNIAARLEGLAPQNGLVISPQTLKLTQGWFEVKSLGNQSLKGIDDLVEVFQVLSESGARSRLDIVTRKGLSPLVGREEEMKLLLRCWERAKTGNQQLVLLSGEAGLGKSRLVDAVKEQIAREPNA
jgi:class 3 adenylate cyclase